MKEYIGLLYGDDGLIYRSDKPYRSYVKTLTALKRMRISGTYTMLVLFDGLVYDWIMLRVEISNWLFSLEIPPEHIPIITEATINNVQNMLIMQSDV